MLFRSKKGPVKKTNKEKVIEMALEHKVKVYEIEEFDDWKVKLRLPHGSSISFNGRKLDWAYEQALNYLKRWTWENREEEVV